MISDDANAFAWTLTREQRAWILALVISVGFMARMLTVHSPLLDRHAWRQTDGAMIARNFYRDGISPFHPQTDARGNNRDGYVSTGLELHAIVFAAVARVAGFAHQVGRAVSAACFPVSALLLWGFMRVRYGEWPGLFAVFIYALGLPLVLYSERAVWNEPLLLLLSLLALRAAQAYLARLRVVVFAVLLAAVALIGAVKPQWLIVLGPIAALWVERDGVRSLLRVELWATVAVGAASAGAILWHMRSLAAHPGAVEFGAGNKLFHMDDMTGHYVYVVTRRLVRDILGPVGLVAWLTGIAVAVRRGRLVEPAAFVSFLVYLVVVSRGNRVHDYYQLALVPGALIALPQGLFTIAAAVSPLGRGAFAWRFPVVAFALAGSMWLFCFGRSISFHSWYSIDMQKEYFCSALGPALAPQDLLVFANYNSPDLMYCLDRRGWLLLEPASTPEHLGALIAAGASVLVVPQPAPPALAGDRTPLVSTAHWAAYRLR